jgi:hypothetical protein
MPLTAKRTEIVEMRAIVIAALEPWSFWTRALNLTKEEIEAAMNKLLDAPAGVMWLH